MQKYQDLRPSPNVVVPIPDKPLIIPFGLPCSGKTMLIWRLHRYLYHLCSSMYDSQLYPCSIKYVSCHQKQNQDANGDAYCMELCDYLSKCLYESELPHWHDGGYSYMLTFSNRINGETYCHFVDLPGEAFYWDNSSVWWTKYLESLMIVSNKRIWLFLIEKDAFGNQQKRDEYTFRINRMLHDMFPKDKVVFVFNKADLYINKYVKGKHIDMMSFMKDIKQQYPIFLFDRYENKGLSKFFKGEHSFNYTFFSSGVFTKIPYMDDGWSPGPDIYCENLWKKIKALL